MGIKEEIKEGRIRLGIEFGSTRIKAVLTDKDCNPIAFGSHKWENHLENGIWTYPLEEVNEGLQDCYAKMTEDVQKKYQEDIVKIEAFGVSAMMHGYLAFDKDDNQLAEFRTWRNTITGEAASELSEKFDFNIPQRWSVAHLYQAILNKEDHVSKISFLTTLAGYVHWKLTGEKVLGIGDASGMFPIDSRIKNYHPTMIKQFDELMEEKGMPWKIEEILPKVLIAGENAGTLTEEGAKLLDPSGKLQAGVPMCPPEGDAGTGMAATNSVAKRTGNISAGTSIFSMIVLEKPLQNKHEAIDIVTTPYGDDVAMVHCNNCTSDINAWVDLFKEFMVTMGSNAEDIDMDELYATLYNKGLEGDKDCGGILSYNYYSGEVITGFTEGRPLFVRTPDSHFNLANFMRMHLYSALATIKIGNDILLKEENVKIDKIYGHGGLYTTKDVGQIITAAALNTPVAVMKTAGEGGAWGISVLASYVVDKKDGEDLATYLNEKVFVNQEGSEIAPNAEDVKGFDDYVKAYKKALIVEAAAIKGI